DLRIRLRAHAHGADGEAGGADEALLDEVAAVAGVHGRLPGGGEPGRRFGNGPSIDGLPGGGDRQAITATDSWSAAGSPAARCRRRSGRPSVSIRSRRLPSPRPSPRAWR